MAKWREKNASQTPSKSLAGLAGAATTMAMCQPSVGLLCLLAAVIHPLAHPAHPAHPARLLHLAHPAPSPCSPRTEHRRHLGRGLCRPCRAEECARPTPKVESSVGCRLFCCKRHVRSAALLRWSCNEKHICPYADRRLRASSPPPNFKRTEPCMLLLWSPPSALQHFGPSPAVCCSTVTGVQRSSTWEALDQHRDKHLSWRRGWCQEAKDIRDHPPNPRHCYHPTNGLVMPP